MTSCSEHFISIKHRILATFNINKKNSILTACMPLNVMPLNCCNPVCILQYYTMSQHVH